VDRDLRGTPAFELVTEHYRRLYEPAFGRVHALAEGWPFGPAVPQPSPDGRRFLFEGERIDGLEDDPLTRIVLAEAGDVPPREITFGPGDDVFPRWSPDGRWISFHSDRELRGRRQLYLLGAEELAEPRALPEVPGTLEYHAWARDGRRILIGSAGIGADHSGASGSGTVVVDVELPRWMPEVQSRENRDVEGRLLHLLDLEEGRLARVGSEELNVWEASWCGPDRAAVVATESAAETDWYDASLRVIDLETGRDRVLLHGDAAFGLPTGSPDGDVIAVVEALCSDRLLVAGDVLLVDPATGDARRVDTLGVDVTHLVWRDATRLFAIGMRGVGVGALEIDATTGTARETWSSAGGWGYWWVPGGTPLGDGDAFVTIVQSHERPPAVSLIDGDDERIIASFEHDGTRYAQEVSGSSERLTWEGDDGLEIEGLVITPRGEGPFPLVVNVHGGPEWAWSASFPDAPTSLLVGQGYAMLLPNPRGSTGRGRRFAELVNGDPGGADAQDILRGIDVLVERRIADPVRIGVMGLSYGGFMSAWIPVVDQRFAAAVPQSPVTDWYSQHFDSNIAAWDELALRAKIRSPGGPYHERSAVIQADRVRTPMLLIAGLRDRCCPPGQAVEMYRALRECGNVESEVAVYPEEAHGNANIGAQIDENARILAWFDRFMPAGGIRAT
jgi:dipeptidyl aminopeptidase/acylaminoacyl peptidase